MAHTLPSISYEQINLGDIRRLVGDDPRLIVEIGAHHGWHTAAFLETFPNVEIYAFEPDPRAIEKFSANITSSRVHLFKMAVGATDGEVDFHASSGLPPGIDLVRAAVVYPRGWDQSGSLRAPKAHKDRWPWCKFESIIRVSVCRLDSWARENAIDTIDLIWADMQGAEGDLVNGGQATLARTRYLYLEYSNDEIYDGEPNLQTLLDMLPNYSVIKRYPGDILLKNLHV